MQVEQIISAVALKTPPQPPGRITVTTDQLLSFIYHDSLPFEKLLLFFGSASFGCGMNWHFKLRYRCNLLSCEGSGERYSRFFCRKKIQACAESSVT